MSRVKSIARMHRENTQRGETHVCLSRSDRVTGRGVPDPRAHNRRRETDGVGRAWRRERRVSFAAHFGPSISCSLQWMETSYDYADCDGGARCVIGLCLRLSRQRVRRDGAVPRSGLQFLQEAEKKKYAKSYASKKKQAYKATSRKQRVARSMWNAPSSGGGAGSSRGCLQPQARALLDRIEQNFGPVSVISTCRPGAVIAGSGKPSKHRYGLASISMRALARARSCSGSSRTTTRLER